MLSAADIETNEFPLGCFDKRGTHVYHGNPCVTTSRGIHFLMCYIVYYAQPETSRKRETFCFLIQTAELQQSSTYQVFLTQCLMFKEKKKSLPYKLFSKNKSSDLKVSKCPMICASL